MIAKPHLLLSNMWMTQLFLLLATTCRSVLLCQSWLISQEQYEHKTIQDQGNAYFLYNSTPNVPHIVVGGVKQREWHPVHSWELSLVIRSPGKLMSISCTKSLHPALPFLPTQVNSFRWETNGASFHNPSSVSSWIYFSGLAPWTHWWTPPAAGINTGESPFYDLPIEHM